mmetsp:Transcript_27795/g.64108  ORF Transcript_27795/g.64108 Transcript_27795/m.64108 type:complete len:241 (-) Transcript_27795:280-1002(-)
MDHRRVRMMLRSEAHHRRMHRRRRANMAGRKRLRLGMLLCRSKDGRGICAQQPRAIQTRAIQRWEERVHRNGHKTHRWLIQAILCMMKCNSRRDSCVVVTTTNIARGQIPHTHAHGTACASITQPKFPITIHPAVQQHIFFLFSCIAIKRRKNAGSSLFRMLLVHVEEMLLCMTGNLNWRPRRDKMPRDIPPVSLPKFLQTHQEQTMLFFCPRLWGTTLALWFFNWFRGIHGRADVCAQR